MNGKWKRTLSLMLTLGMVAGTALPAAAAAAPSSAATNATYYNNASIPAADPYVLYDKESGYYYAYSTDGANKGYYFGIYRSPDLVTWEKASDGAIAKDDPNQWGSTWFWAPEVYHNEDTGLYYIFYSAMLKPELREEAFGYADFGEACKIGVAVSDTPDGPFRIIADHPIDYYPYDPDYYDVNLIMDEAQMKPPATLEEGMTAPKGTYIPTIDADVFFDDDGRMYLYYSRNAYRNWVWDSDLGKYIEESNIYAVELNTEWWSDPEGKTMPTVKEEYVNATKAEDDPADVRKDGFVPIINYAGEKQAWENAHVNDYEKYEGTKKDRRWSEGSTTLKYYFDKDNDGEKEAIYYILYSCNNFENENYGVGYAVADNPLGPWDKYDLNPILSQDDELGMYSTGHGSFITTPDGTESYYVYHGRSSTTGGRRMYTDRMFIDESKLDENGNPVIWVDQSTSDRPVPSGMAPCQITADVSALSLNLANEETGKVTVDVTTASGAKMPLSNTLNRIHAVVGDNTIADVAVEGNTVTVTPKENGSTTLTLTYQRLSSSGEYYDVKNGEDLLSIEIPVEITATIVGPSVDHDDDKEEPTDPENPDIEDPDTPLNPAPDFTDVADDFWGKEAIDYVVAEGLMNGTSETTFAPNVTTTRAMLMTILARMDGVDTTGSDPWYAKGMEWAVAEGVSDGTNPEGTITREQLAVMLYRYSGSPEVSADALTFADADAVSTWAVDGVRWAVANGILSGKGNNTLDPQGNATRAEVAQMLYNFSKIG